MAETTSRNARKVRTGVVVSISGDKSITVKIDYRKHHPKYGKMMTISRTSVALATPSPSWRPARCLRPSVGVSWRLSSAPSKY